MIEDINERMTQFAPSQNNPLNDDPIAEEIAIARQVTPQPDAATIDVDPIAEEIAQSRRDLMMATFGSAADANPDQAAQAKKLGEQFGVGADIAGRNMQQLKKQALLDELERRDLMRRDPILARYLSNHDFAAMAHDDIDNLAKTEDLFQGSWFARYEDPIAYGKKTISMIDERFRRGRAIVEMGRANDLLGLRAQWSPDPRKASEISEELKKLTTEGGIVGAGVEVVGQMIEGIPEVAETTAMGATAGGAVGAVGGPAGFVTIPAGMLTGAGAGFAAGSARSAFMAESGNSYQQMIEQGYDPEVARKAAIGVGVVNASIEMISFGALGPVLRKLGVNVFRPAVANALAKPTAAKALATLGSDYAKAVAAGASEEFLQEIATGIGDDIARVYGSSSPSRILDEGGITDLLGTALESGVQGAMGMAILGGIGPVANFRYDMRRAGAAERQQAFFERLSANAVDSKLRGRDMNAFERFVASQAEGTEAETIFVDAAAMQGVLRQSNLSDEQIDEALPGVREQLQAAAQTGGDVTLPTASFAARVAGTDLGNAMLPHVRLAPDAMSVTEAQEFQKNRDQLVEQARVIMEEKGRADDAFVQEARAIEDRIYQEVVATGTMDENAARANATFVRDLYVTMAARMNTTPAALEQRFPYRVEAQGVAITEPLEQASTVDKGGVATPKYRRAWHKAQTGTPITVTAWHAPGGSEAAQLTDFARERMGRNTTLGNGWYGARDRDIAETYGKPDQFEVTLQNPFVFSEPSRDFVLKITNEELQRIRDAGHDGIIVKGVNATLQGQDRSHLEVIAFNPEQAVRQVPAANIMQQAAPGPARGGFDPSRLTTILNKNADLSTFIHETAHFYLTILGNLAADPAATPEIRADMDTLLKWFGIAGDTDAARIAAWNEMSVDQQRKYHEQFAYSFEVYMFEGKAPSAEMQGLFDRFSAWLKRVYRSIRDDLNAIYRREFGEDLPLLTGEVRQVMDRMLASEEQIKRQAAINEMKPWFQTQEQSGMDDAEWAAYQQMQQEAVEAAVTDMNKASLRQMQWLSNARARILRDLQAKHAKQRREIREEVAEEIRRQPLYRAMEYLRTGTFIDDEGNEIETEGPHKLDSALVKQMYALETFAVKPQLEPFGVAAQPGQVGFVVAKDADKDFLKRLSEAASGKNAIIGKDGLYPDAVAETFGYSSGDELIRALIKAQPMKEAIDARTDELMLERFSELSTPEGREAKVQESLHNEARARLVAVELRFVAKATQPARVLVEAAKQAAREMIAAKRIADLRPSEFIAAEARAARAAGKIGKPVNVDTVAKAAETRAMNIAREQGLAPDEVMAAGVEAGAIAQQAAQARLDEQRAQYGADPAQALIRAKRAQLYQNQLAAEALAARDEVEKGVRYLRQVMRDSNVKRMGADVADQIDRILERFNLRPMSAKRMAERQSLVQWLESLKESGLEPDLAPEILDEAARKPYREMTVAEFRDLVDAVKQLEYIGKNAQKIKRAQEMAEFEEVRDEIVASVRGNFTGKEKKPRSPTTSMGKRIAKAKRFLYSHLKAAAIARIMDGGKDDGPVWNFLIRTANEAGDMETRMRAEATKRLTEILAPVFALGKMGGKGIYFETVGMSLNREARLVIALNMGNDGNRQRLLDGEGWTLEQVQPILESLTEAEWKAVQDVWDYMESFRPLVGAKERRLYGREPKWVTPVPFTVRTADGKEVRLSGGYYPIKYDPVATERAETADEAEKARTELRGAYTAATTRRSFTKARADKVEDRPLLYTMTGVYSGINDVIHDLAWHEWLIQANRLMRDEKFDRAVRETYGAEFKSQLKGWIKDVAAGERGAEDAADMFASYIRRSVSAAGLGFNIVSAILQVTGFSQSIVRVGAKHIARGVAVTTASPVQTMKFVNEKSSFMQERARTQFRELNELRNMVGDESAAQRRLRLGTYFLMMRMQRMVDVPTWVGAYEKALEAGKDDATAVALADQAVIDSQGSGMLKDLSKIERGGALSKLFTVFYSYMNTVYNMAAVSTMTPRSKGRLAADYAMLFIVPVVLNYALKKALTPDVDDEEPDMEKIATDLVAEELAFLMGTMVGVREFQNAANAVVGKETAARGYEGPAGLRAIGEAGRFAVQAKQLEFDRAFRRSAINMLGIGLGLPSAQINRTIDGIEALAEGETENPFAVMTGVQR